MKPCSLTGRRASIVSGVERARPARFRSSRPVETDTPGEHNRESVAADAGLPMYRGDVAPRVFGAAEAVVLPSFFLDPYGES